MFILITEPITVNSEASVLVTVISIIGLNLTDEQVVEGVVLLLHLLPEEHRETEQVADEAEDAHGHVAVPAQQDLVLLNIPLAFTNQNTGWPI